MSENLTSGRNKLFAALVGALIAALSSFYFDFWGDAAVPAPDAPTTDAPVEAAAAPVDAPAPVDPAATPVVEPTAPAADAPVVGTVTEPAAEQVPPAQ